MKKIQLGRYRHYKGKFYQVIAEARHSETLEEMVVYQALYKTKFGKNLLWVRPKKMFLEEIVIDGKKVKRFRFVSVRTRSGMLQ